MILAKESLEINRDFRKMIKVTGRVLHIFLCLHLCLTICSVRARADLCSCGQACAHCLSDQQPDDNLSYHKHCHGSDCKTCKVKRLTSLDMKVPRTEEYGKKGRHSAHITISCADDPLREYTSNESESIRSVPKYDPPPIYLNTCSFLC